VLAAKIRRDAEFDANVPKNANRYGEWSTSSFAGDRDAEAACSNYKGLPPSCKNVAKGENSNETAPQSDQLREISRISPDSNRPTIFLQLQAPHDFSGASPRRLQIHGVTEIPV